MAMLQDLKQKGQQASQSVLVRMFFLGFLILLLQIPAWMIGDTIFEREQTRLGAIQDVTRTWGERQALIGPILVVPYKDRWRDEKGNVQEVTRHAFFQPETLTVDGDVATEKRYRGIFEVPLYLATLSVQGEFKRPDFSAWPIAQDDILWEGATLVVGLSDPRALREQVTLEWNEAKLPFEPGRASATFLPAGLHVPGVLGRRDKSDAFRFAFSLVAGGSDSLQIAPVGRDTHVSLASPWPDPSFVGSYLPTQRQVQPSGFRADWKVPHLGRNYPQSWLDEQVRPEAFQDAVFGVSFISPVDAYTATTRAVKYEILFVFLTFLAFYLFELFFRLRIHPVQYLLVGFAICIFYLLLLALAEHIGFDLAYGIAALGVVTVIGGYCSVILGKQRLGLYVAAELAVLYGFLYTLMQVQDYALLAGALGLFVVLAGVMFVTRRIDWYRVGAAREA